MQAVDAPVGCPNCGAARSSGMAECDRCGIIYAKFRSRRARRDLTPPSAKPRWWPAIRQWLLDLDHTTDTWTWYGRAGLWLVLLWWSGRFILAPLESNYAGESFLHLVNLPFHEAGHLLFMPFGRFMAILGGSLGQVLMPLACLAAFLVQTRDPFAASVALWWTAESLMDIAPYINDARALELILLGGVTGKETDGHDWNNLLGMLGWLDYDHRLALFTHGAGIALMAAAMLWGGALLHRHHARRRLG